MQVAVSSLVAMILALSDATCAWAEPCVRWQASVTCEQVNNVAECDQTVPEPGFLSAHIYKFNKVKHQYTTDDACTNTGYYNRGRVAGYSKYIPRDGNCEYADIAGNIVVTPIFSVTVDVDEMCKIKVSGPYKQLYSEWKNSDITLPNGQVKKVYEHYSIIINQFTNTYVVPGREYSINRQRKVFMWLNRFANEGDLLSDYPKGAASPTKMVDAGQSNPNLASMQHIIPAHDSHNCPCGANSLENALVMPKKLNNDIGNDPSNPVLRQIINDWRVPD